MHRRSVLALGLWGLLALTACEKPHEPLVFNSLDITGASFGRDFNLTDTQGRARSLADYRGKVVLMFFGFTQCPDICPTTLARAAQVRKRLGPAGEGLQVLFVTLDPERDAPAMLAEYTQAFDASFVGLHAPVADIRKLADEYRIFYRKVPTPDGYTIDHTALSYAYDRQGRLRLAVAHELSVEQVTTDLRQLLDGN